MSKMSLHCFITGRVQGVFFRRATCNKAKELQLTGWVKNLPDGRVETVICGEAAALSAMRDWLWEGPPVAKVTDVLVQEIPWQEYAGFEVR